MKSRFGTEELKELLRDLGEWLEDKFVLSDWHFQTSEKKEKTLLQQRIALPATENVQGIIALTRAPAWWRHNNTSPLRRVVRSTHAGNHAPPPVPSAILHTDAAATLGTIRCSSEKLDYRQAQ